MDELNSFISESVIMKDFKHRNVLGLVGVSVGVEEDKAVPYIILPFMANGDLKRYLKDKRTAAGRDVKALFKVCIKVLFILYSLNISREGDIFKIEPYFNSDLCEHFSGFANVTIAIKIISYKMK